MTITIGNICVLVCAVINLWCAYWYLKAKKHFKKTYMQATIFESMFDDMIQASNADNAEYIIAEHDNCVEVWRETFINDNIEHVLIKRFADEDMEYNQREAQELCDKLNEK